MKKVVLLVLFLLSVSYSFAQLQERLGVKSVIGASAAQKENLNLQLTQTRNGVNGTFKINSVGVQVGLPYMGVTNVPQTNNPSQYYRMDLGFPWGIRYRYSTFSEDAFTVSKGYYTDKVSINWGIKNNVGLITDFAIYRSTDISGTNPDWGNPIATLSSTARSYDDVNTEGGKLYRYKVLARGVESVQNIYSSYIVGIGYRNPTAVITGNVSFNTGNPVKNVLISASPTGATLNFGSSLKIPGSTFVAVNRLHKVLKDSLTIQVWAKPETNFNNDAITLYELRSNLGQSKYFKVKLGVVNNRNTLTLTIEEPNLGDHIITVSDFIPNGEVDNKGADVLVPITNVNGSFTHFSAVLRNNAVPEIYINGRLITANYVAQMNTILANNAVSGTTPPTVVFSSSNIGTRLNTSPTGYPQSWTQFNLGGGKTAYLDEFRVWETALTPAQIQTDFRRYLKGNESYLHTYITGNEGTGSYAYDLSSTGFSFHGNDAKLDNIASFGNIIPTNTQLGILGVTDQYGNFVISAVPYTGNGNSYTLVPSLGKHKFNPTQQMVYVGVGSTVINNINFKDISSFVFKGRAVYDSRGVFPSTSDPVITGDIKENESYNAYIKGNLKYQKGEYWAEKNADGVIVSLKRYAAIPVPDAYITIDNEPAIDANNVPIMTDINGLFTIQVPIGQHAISISKSGHYFSFEGRFPAKTSSVVNGQTVVANTYQDFYQDQDEPITFIDNTKVTVIGRVVGGSAQADQVIGFGDSGKKTYTYIDAGGVNKSIDYTSVNNIGQANLTLGYMPVGATSVTPEYKTRFQTNSETGEFRVKLLPLNYTLSQNDLTFKNGKNPGNRPLLDQDKTINFTAINAFKTPTFSQGSTTINGEPYQEILKYTYTADPVFNVLSQNSDTQITADGKTYTIASDQATPIYSQFGNYQIQIQGLESYNNYDNSVTNPVVSTVPVSGGEIIATNNIALENSELTETSQTDPSVLVYSFRGGMPNTDAASGYKRTINLLYRLNGIDYPLTNYKNEGILLGGVSDGTQSFVTAGPQLPDFVLRDPPGSNSSATIEKGSSFTFSKESSYTSNKGNESAGTVSSGFELSIGGGLLGPVTKTDVTNDTTLGVAVAQSSSNGKSVEKTYTFSQSISTSDDPSWVGSDADLYIGYSANQIYGTYNNLTTTATQNNALPIKVVPLANTTANVIYPKINKAIYFNEAPEKTFFIYSQRSIINDLIPKYEGFVSKINDGSLIENQNGVLSKNAYLSSINLWKKIILNNELSKYYALNEKDKLKASLNSIVDGLKDPVTKTFSTSAKQLKDLLNATFFENISLDAGVGGFTKSYQVDKISSSSLSYELQIDASVGLTLGTKINETGYGFETTTTNGYGKGSSSQDQNSTSTNVNYTLKDADAGNLLSVDVINPFDGNGPIFITKGGETSCPNEAAELSHYYKPSHPNVTGVNPTIVDLDENERIPLSVATVALEKPEIKVLSSNVTGVFEGRNAEFTLKLRNNSTVNKDATFLLAVDQTTNPDNALINIEPNGTMINIPAGQTVTYTMTLKKVKQDQFNYNNIVVSLQSLCDGNATSSVSVSATFIPSCSTVSIMSPSNNWLMNRNTAFDGGVSKPLNIKLGDYNTTFSSFKKINLEYRLKGSPNWTGLKTYYKNQVDYSAAMTGGDNNVELISGDQLNYAFDIAGLGLSNGTYEIRARSTCYNNTVYESAIIQGIVDLSAPVVFGTPTPTNGILGLGNDIAIRFNEPIKTNGTVTKFEFLVQKNQLPVNHQVSLSFNGSSNTATINKPFITTGDLSIEFWMKNSSLSGTSTLLSQSGGLKVELIDNVLKYTLGAQSISATILKDNNFNHYTLSYNSAIPKLSIIENDKELASTTSPNPITTLSFTNSNPIVIGGNTFKGNIHDLRLWNKPITRDQSVANMNVALNGNENGIIGFWPINEGNGTIANDIARYKDLVILNANWDIFPKGTAYDFNGTSYLSTNSNTFSKVIISKEMDATVSFWMKTAQANATILSNGKGDTSDFVEPNQFRNKWAFNTNANGGLELAAEGNTFAFGNLRVNDNAWHHVALSLTRNGGLSLYVDGNQMGSYSTATIGGFSSTNLFIGARGQSNASVNSIDRYYTGQLDELCIWNMARTADQIKADMYFEQDPIKTTGLLFYSNFNKPEVANSNGPKYYYPQDAFTQVSDYLLLNGQVLNFTDITPAIKPYRPTESIVLNPVINGDQIVMVPDISSWASIEGKVAYITVSNLNDMYDNRQASPVTWTAFINKNPIKMFVEGQGDIVNLVKTTDLPLSFPITIVNQGGLAQPYSFTVPNWLKLSSSSGVLDPNKSTTVTATVDMNLAPGTYNNIISLTTNYGIDKKIQLNLRVLVNEPKLNFSPSNFTQTMNIIAKIKVDGIISNDIYDRIYAMANGPNGLEVRGKAALTFDAQLNTYNVFLTVYSNVVSGENISFFIWDASQGNFLEASLDTLIAVPFISDSIIGNFSNPAICENTNVSGQLVTLQPGWTWVSFNVNDPRFGSLNNMTTGVDLSTSDLIQSNSPALFDSYQFYSTGSASNGWSGGITSNGGISTNKMYKLKIAKGGEFKLKGIPADLNTWSFNLQAGWNWLPYVANKNIPIGDALANLNPVDGDLIKSQSLFAIYSSVARAWKGTLTYLNQSEGYMIKVANAQTLTYPSYINKINNSLTNKSISGINQLKINGVNTTNLSLLAGDVDNTILTLSPDYSKFANTMNAVVKLPEGFNELYFYNDAHELRGNSKTINVDGQELAFITVYGETAENLTAFIGANNTSQETAKTLKFSSDVLMGTIAEPILIELGKQELSIYPNPFHDELKVVLNSKEKGETKIIIYSITGQIIYEKNFDVNAGTNVLKIQPNVPSGAYVMIVQIDGKEIVNKIIKD
jgi:Concanavalin A-like lectin/glucanases superfamily/Secretion system C-terminal sorting domain